MTAYKCEECGDDCLSDWTEEEAVAEMLRVFPGCSPSTKRVRVCDQCYQRLMAAMRS